MTNRDRALLHRAQLLIALGRSPLPGVAPLLLANADNPDDGALLLALDALGLGEKADEGVRTWSPFE